ncbi:glycosyl hydrolase [Phenylobacterium sp. LjRoot225]|uniref:glycosyl hydrolase n=1 Tax=Phenylobacterium sp. LjRoot225 TaxID=3342285 RepID=UPI003ED1632A
MQGRKMKVLAAALLASTALAGAARSQGAPAEASLQAGFQNPPNSARPRVWWHWMNGNITQDGIRKDIEWMSRVGIGGLQNFDAELMTPKVVETRLAYMTPAWKEAFRYAAELADQHGLELAIASSPGWSETGGPWVAPKDAMKKLVWSETVVDGGRRFVGVLAPLPQVTGPFQDMPRLAGIDAMLGGKAAPSPTFHGDASVLAYRLPAARALPTPKFSAGAGEALDAKLLGDGDVKTVVQVARQSADQPTVIVLDYAALQTVRSADVYIPSAQTLFGEPALEATLEAQDGAGWRKVAEVPLSNVPTTVSFAPATAARFRLVMKPPAGPTLMSSFMNAAPGVAMALPMPPAPKTVRVADLRLSGEARVNAFEMKAGFAVAPDYYALDGDAGPEIAGVAPTSIVDLTGKIGPDGKLDWTPPPGRWKVLRFGYSLVGTTNHPATAEATGLEVDKYDGEAVRRYMETYIASYAATTGPELIGQRGLRAILTDSTEVGPSNWTPDMVAQFQRLRGYDPRPWMPALAGVVVGSRKDSDAFLYDFRRTLADLHASQHYGTVADVAHKHGLKVYGEALEAHRPVLGDDMAMRSHTDVPMAAMWTYNPDQGPKPTYLADLKGAASVAHIYGQNLVAAESLTSAMSPWAFVPSDLKPFIDLEFASGVNRPVIHTSVHQPLDDKVPGLSLFIFGQYFNRHESWAELARPWVDYMARSSYLLQQGRNVADVGYFYGEEAPLTSLYGDKPVADAPVRYAYDFVGADALMNHLKPDGGELVATGGARYRVLYLGGSSRRMTLATLRRLAELADAGVTIVGPAPEGSPSLKDNPAEYQALVRRLWSGAPVTQVGKGRVFASQDVEAALGAAGATPDFRVSGAADADVPFVHRRLADGDLYFVNNRKARAETLEARFRVSGKAPEIWRADTGKAEPVSYRIEGAETVVPLDMLPQDAFFVVFRTPATAQSVSVPARTWTSVGKVDGPWTVAFQPGRAAPASARFDRLQSLTESADPGIKYFSGVAAYRQTFIAPRGLRPGAPVMLDLGQVADIAQVLVNGKEVGYAWKAPYRVEVTSAIRPGKNTLEVRVADRWVNRLIGDAQPGAKPITYTTMKAYKPDAQLRPSGLLGPVTLLAQ